MHACIVCRRLGKSNKLTKVQKWIFCRQKNQSESREHAIFCSGTINMVKHQILTYLWWFWRLPRTFFSLISDCVSAVQVWRSVHWRCIEALVNIHVPTKGSNQCAADFACDQIAALWLGSFRWSSLGSVQKNHTGFSRKIWPYSEQKLYIRWIDIVWNVMYCTKPCLLILPMHGCIWFRRFSTRKFSIFCLSNDIQGCMFTFCAANYARIWPYSCKMWYFCGILATCWFKTTK